MPLGSSFLSTFIYYFAVTAIGITAVVSQATDLKIATGIPQQLGAVGGVLVGLVGVYFNRLIVIVVPFLEQERFLVELETLLAAIDYPLQSKGNNTWVYGRSGINQWLSGRVFVKIEGQAATIASRAVHIRQIEPQIQANKVRDRAAELKRSRQDLE
jgi:hypothetical protein